MVSKVSRRTKGRETGTVVNGTTLSLMDSQAWLVLPLITVMYIGLQTILGMHETSTCKEPYKPMPWVVALCAIGSILHLCNGLYQIGKISILWTKAKFTQEDWSMMKIFSAQLCIGFIAGSSQFLTLAFDFGGTCRDSFNVHSAAAQWAEWFTCVPFLVYIATAVEQKVSLTLLDTILISCNFLMVACGAMMSLQSIGPHISAILLALSVTSLLVFIGLVYWENYSGVHPNAYSHDLIRYIEALQKYQKRSLLTQLTWIFPYFPLVYVLGATGYFSADDVIGANIVGSVVGKLLFSSAFLGSHIKLQKNIRPILDSEKSE